jgi:hypothetical protein
MNVMLIDLVRCSRERRIRRRRRRRSNEEDGREKERQRLLVGTFELRFALVSVVSSCRVAIW